MRHSSVGLFRVYNIYLYLDCYYYISRVAYLVNLFPNFLDCLLFTISCKFKILNNLKLKEQRYAFYFSLSVSLSLCLSFSHYFSLSLTVHLPLCPPKIYILLLKSFNPSSYFSDFSCGQAESHGTH